MDQFSDRLDRLSELSEDELKSLETDIASSFESIDQSTLNSEVVQSMKAHVAAVKSVRSELNGRIAQAQELQNAAQELSSEMSASTDEESEESEGEPIEAPESPLEKEDVTVDEEQETKNPAKSVDPEEDKIKEASVEEVATESAPAEAELSTEEPAAEEPAAEAELSTSEETPQTEPATELSVDEVHTESSEEPVTASANTDGLQAPEDNAPSIAIVDDRSARVNVAITAGADIPNTPMGSSLPDMRAVANALLERKRAWGNTTGGDGEKSTVAKITTTYPESRVLDEHDITGNRKKVEAVVAAAMKKNDEGQAMVAAGGIVAPVENRYDLFSYAESTARPIRDSLLVFAANRGGIRYITPPVLSDVEGSVSLWTLQNDIDAATEGEPNPVKPCLRVTAGKEVTVYTEAIPLCLTFGNLHARTYPELVERHTELAMVWHARFAEVRLLTRIGLLSAPVSAPSQLGAARDIFAQVDTAVAGYRSRNRLDDNAPMRAIFPSWFRNALRVDLIKQMPGDGRDGTFNLKPAEIDSWFAARNINVTWHNDGEDGQIFGEQENATINEVPEVALGEGTLVDFPDDVIWYLFAEGTFLFLDGGELDLGLVRDSTLNGTNDYKIFLETFEGVAKVGIESLRIRSALAFQGSTSGTVDLAPAV